MREYPKESRNKVVRGASRATYDQETIFSILDAGFLCHLSYNLNDQPFMIPTAYARDGEKIYVHGSVKSRTMKETKKGVPICLCVTHLDGLVLARSAFHHSVNYRSAVIFGKAKEIESSTTKNEALRMITENFLKGRWDEVRQPSQKELDITSVLEIQIDSASAKIRSGHPMDDEADYELDIWAGQLPIRKSFQEPITDEKLKSEVGMSQAVRLAWESSKP